MTAVELFKLALAKVGISQAQAAVKIGMSKQSLNQKVVRNTLRADEFIRLLDEIGVDFKMYVRETGEEIEQIKQVTTFKGEGNRTKQMVHGVSFDTAKASALSNNFHQDHEGEDAELYIDSEYRYFFAEYDSSGKGKIVPVSASIATAFIDKFGPIRE